jgi:hypothetical protein
VRIHRQKPKALGLKFGCGFTRHLFIKVLRLRDIDLLEAALLPRKLKPGPSHSIHHEPGRASVGEVIEAANWCPWTSGRWNDDLGRHDHPRLLEDGR